MARNDDDRAAALGKISADGFNARIRGALPGLIGIHIDEVSAGAVETGLTVRDELLAPNGYLHAATVVALADTSCGCGSLASLPEGATGFTTIELKTNFLGTVRAGEIRCSARMIHGGRRTQVWDAEVRDASNGAVIAMFRCTQMLLY